MWCQLLGIDHRKDRPDQIKDGLHGKNLVFLHLLYDTPQASQEQPAHHQSPVSCPDLTATFHGNYTVRLKPVRQRTALPH